MISIAYASNPLAESACSGCHFIKISGIQVTGDTGGRTCAQRSVSDWTTTIETMIGKGAPPLSSSEISDLSNYFAGIGLDTTTTTATTNTTVTTTTTTTEPPPAVCPLNSSGVYPSCACDAGYYFSSPTVCSLNSLLPSNDTAGLIFVIGMLLMLFIGFQSGLTR